jgi:hypothetical protein
MLLFSPKEKHKMFISRGHVVFIFVILFIFFKQRKGRRVGDISRIREGKGSFRARNSSFPNAIATRKKGAVPTEAPRGKGKRGGRGFRSMRWTGASERMTKYEQRGDGRKMEH